MKSPMRCIAIVGLIIGAISLALPALADPPPWAPAHGYRQKQARVYKYYYYPAQKVYYAPDRGTYFWLGSGGWQVGATLPNGIRIDAGQKQVIELNSERPYER